MFDRAGAFVSRHWLLVVAGWLLLAVLVRMVAPRWNDVAHDGDLAYLPAQMPSVQGEKLLASAFPDQRAKSQIAIIFERSGGPLTPDDLQFADRLTERLSAERGRLPIVDVWTRKTEIVGDKLLSRYGPSGQANVVVLQLSNEFMATDNMRILRRVGDLLDRARRDPTLPRGLEMGVSGSAALGGDMLASAVESIQNTELATIILVILILLVVYRAPVLVLIPLITIGLSLFVSLNLLALLTQVNHLPHMEWWNFKIFTTTKIFIVVILFGAGTDFCLFLISRFKEELQHGLAPDRAIERAVAQVGHALVGSAATTIFGLSMMYFAAFGKFRNSGPAIALCLAITLAACLTLAPALVRAGGAAIFWPFKVRVHQTRILSPDGGTTGSFWDWASRVILARPGWILAVSVLAMLPLAYEGLSVPVTYDLLNELDLTRVSVRGTEMARRHFAAGETSPVTIMALLPEGNLDSRAGEKAIAKLTKKLYGVEGVACVRSLAEPLGDPPGFFQPLRASGLRKLAARKHKYTQATYLTQVPQLSGKVTRFDVVTRFEPFSIEALAVVDDLSRLLNGLSDDRASAWHGARFDLLGATAGVRDLRAVTESDRTLIQRLTVIGVLAVLLVILRRPVVCLYLIASVLFSYLVTLGATELMFGWLYADTFLGLDWKVPIFLFVILIAVGEDYNIYLVTRVIEEQQRHGPLEGLRLAVARTGGIITSCGVIMAGTFISMMSGNLRGMLELGFALSLGVMLDTCVVRPILVPAFMALLARRAMRRARDNTAAASGSDPAFTSAVTLQR